MDQRRLKDQRSDPAEYLPADAAARLLGVKLQTLYAYASRGLVASLPGEHGRARRYRKSDLVHLKTRAEARSGHGPVAAAAMSWGEPVLESGITLIAAGGPYYRGVSALKLIADATPFERVAELLWGSMSAAEVMAPRPAAPAPAPAASRAKKSFAGAAASRADVASRAISALIAGKAAVVDSAPAATVSWPAVDLGAKQTVLAALAGQRAHPLSKMALVVPAIALADEGRVAAPLAAELARARSLVRRLAAAVALPEVERMEQALGESTVAATLAVALDQDPTPLVCDLLNRALVLCADHELNSSTFAARIAASTGADLYACVAAALATLSGPGHGGACDRVEALILEVGEPEHAASALRARLARGESVPGFASRPYADVDPRTGPLFEGARMAAAHGPNVATLFAVAQAMEKEGREPPTMDAGLVALAFALGLPPGSASALFAVGRCAGWIAHVLEQRQAPALLRPRARYVGPLPS